jgi:D-alanyl-D-alanine carboxypeptidase/D-alanyl-D-alanine-endopeptidase (penicillin-binding protein 4)
MKHNDLPLRPLFRRATTLLLAAFFLAPGHATADRYGTDWTVRQASAQSIQRRTPARTRSVRRERPAPVARVWSSPTGAGALSADLGAILGDGVRNGTWGVLAVSLTRGDTLYSVNPDEMLQPASTMKLFTAALSLDQ